MKTKFFTLTLLVLLFMNSCQNSDSDIQMDTDLNKSSFTPTFQKTESIILNLDKSQANKGESSSMNFMKAVNQAFRAKGILLQLSAIESYSADGEGKTVFFNSRGNKQLSSDFVPNDPRRYGVAPIVFGYDGFEGSTKSGLSQSDTDGAIENAMNTWDNVSCSSGLDLYNIGPSPFNMGYVQAIITEGASGPFFYTDIMHSGFNTEVTDAVFGPGSNVLGVTFTFFWGDYDSEGNFIPSDVDNNGKNDVAFRDIYYNDAYKWSLDGSGIDVETVALHEAGHGLSQGHFGKFFRTDANDKFHFSPRAVMNAGYTGIQTTISQSDNGGHCSNWSEWPNN